MENKEKDIEQDKKIKELQKENEEQNKVNFNNFRNLYKLNDSCRKSLTSLEKTMKDFYTKGVKKKDVKIIEESIHKMFVDLQANTDNDKEIYKNISERINSLRTDLAKSLKSFEKMVINDETIKLIKQNLKDDIERWLHQVKKDNEQNKRINHLEIENNNKELKDKRQSDLIKSLKEEICDLRLENTKELSNLKINFQKMNNFEFWFSIVLALSIISNILLWFIK